MKPIALLLAASALSAALPVRSPVRAADAVGTDAPLEQTVFLVPRDPQGEERYARAVQTPGPLFHRFLSCDAFVTRFAPTDADIASVRSALEQLGYTVRGVSANHLSIAVVAPAATTQRALGIGLARVTETDRSGWVPAGTPVLPASMRALVRSIGGFDTLHAPTSQAEPASDAVPRQHVAGTPITGGQSGFLLPQELPPATM